LGAAALDVHGVISQAVQTIKSIAPDLLVITDLCFCEYTDHGHCGVLSDKTGQLEVDNDATLIQLAKQAVVHAQAGADIIAPSGMMDGMISAIRSKLDLSGYSHIPLLSYSVKYASSFYAPFREAAQGTPKFGNRKTYQMDPANTNEGLREAELDIQEGADILMVKPAHTYLDIIFRIKQTFPEIPLAAYHVSGEYSMIKAAGANGWIDETQVMLEVLMSIKRAGADFILTYFAKDAAKKIFGAPI
jgi:porphobilinogen synthase